VRQFVFAFVVLVFASGDAAAKVPDFTPRWPALNGGRAPLAEAWKRHSPTVLERADSAPALTPMQARADEGLDAFTSLGFLGGGIVLGTVVVPVVGWLLLGLLAYVLYSYNLIRVRIAFVFLTATAGCSTPRLSILPDSPTVAATPRGPPTRRVGVVFIHGLFGSADATFEKLPVFVRAQLPATVATFEYPHAWSIESAAARLDELLVEKLERQGIRRLVLVGHSLGGLVAQELVNQRTFFDRAVGVELVVLIATPNFGSKIARIAAITPDTQLRALGLHDSCVKRHTEFLFKTKNLRHGRLDVPGAQPVAVAALVGTGDKVVPAASARGFVAEIIEVKGNHRSIVKPEAPDDEVVQILVRKIRELG
jgi:pimeloyl-ACP methyl ester carboxylesterase